MLVPVKWLKEYVDFDLTVTELADKLVACGFEIEEIIDLSSKIQGVVVGQILSLEKHPDADKLQICSIDVGKDQPVAVVTGATNVKVGDKVPVALDGAVLPSGKTIRTGALRGVTSYGMLCSGEELGLTEADYRGASVYGILILRDEAEVGKDINIELGNDDIVLDVAITANRTDANSIVGIACEVAAVTGKPFKGVAVGYQTSGGNIADSLKLENLAPDLCPRYLAAMVKDVVITESPAWMKNRLRAVGLRPINNIVDVTNYVLTEIGQPMHAFDLSTIKGGKIVVRRAAENEPIVALDGKQYLLQPNQLAICNAEEPMAVAGVMGGQNYSIFDTTDTIVFESARFQRNNIRRTSRALNLRSDSSARYEKGIDYQSQRTGIDRALTLIAQNGWGKIVGGELDSFPNPPKPNIIGFTADDLERILGVRVPEAEILKILNALQIATTLKDGTFESIVPGNREDIVGVNDIAEEVIRIYGYDHIESTLMRYGKMVVGERSKTQRVTDKVKNLLVGKGFCETVTYSFISPKAFDLLGLAAEHPLRTAVRLDNPLGEDFSVMRTTLIHSMLKTLSVNMLRSNKSAALFEVAKTYAPKALPLTELPDEPYKLCLGAYATDFYAFKGVAEELLDVLRIDAGFRPVKVDFLHPGRSAEIYERNYGVVLGYLGEVDSDVADRYGMDKKVYVAELNLDLLIERACDFDSFRVISRYQSVDRDLALIAKTDVAADRILSVIRAAGGELLTESSIFDVYCGDQIEKGYKSVAVKLTLQSADHTLKDAEVNVVVDKVLAELGLKLNVTLR